MRKIIYLVVSGILLCSMFTACGPKPRQEETQEEERSAQSASDIEPEKDASTEKEDASVPEKEDTKDVKNKRGSRIEDQTFDVTLQPLGKVTFASYEPDTSQNPLADAVFTIEQDGAVIQELKGLTEDNCRSNERFNMVEAVSFLDYNHDGADDIIVICKYSPASEAETLTGYSEIRYYTGSENGDFSYEKQMSMDATAALSEITIQTAKDFIGASGGSSLQPWQQVYLDYLGQDSEVEGQDGYALIYLDEDEIPELVEIGNSEAAGCRIVNFFDDMVHVTQLNRLNFSYIEYGNLLCNAEGLMDNYYDLVYSIVDGTMVLVAEGYYGAEDNANLEFDSEGNPVYQYEWNDVKMSKAEYEKELNRVYDSSRAKTGYDRDALYSADELMEILESFAQ